MTTPYTGPSANAPSRAGKSEKSILTKDGMSIGMGNSMNIRIKATALSMAATVRLWVVFFFMVMIPSRAKGPVKMFRKLFSYRRSCSHKHCTPLERLCHSVRPAHESSFLFWNGKDKQKSALLQQKHCNRARRQQFACRFLHPDYTVGPGITPGQHPQKVVADLEISLIALARRLNFFVPLARSGNESSFLTASGESHPALKRTFWHRV